MFQANLKSIRDLILTTFVVFSFSSFVQGQNNIYKKVQAIESSIQIQKQQVPLSEYVSTKGKQEKILLDFPNAVLLNIDKSVIASIINKNLDYLNLTIPGPNNKAIDLLMYKNNLHSPGYISRTGSGDIYESTSVFYHGIIKGDNQSIAAISFFDNQIIGMIQMDGKSYTLAKLTGEEMDHILYDNIIIEGKSSYSCHTNIEEHLMKSENVLEMKVYNTENCVNMYIEVDNDIFVNKGGLIPTTNYIDGVMNEVSILYSNESIEFGVSEMVVWDVADPYTGPSTSNYLDQFRNELNGVYNGDLAHLIGYGGGGGIAYVNVLCNAVYGIGYSGISSSYNNVPAYSWTVEVLTHEIGHNLGSRHTHDCAWNGNNTAIDGCGPAAGYSSGCDAPVPNAGTIMSYCHLLGGVGIDFNLGFGPQPGNLIRDKVYNSTCLVPCAPCNTIGNPCDDGDICTINDVYDTNCNCIGTFEDTDGDGVCDAEDQCPGENDNLDTDNDGNPDCIECSTGSYTTNNFNPSPLTHSGGGSSTTILTYPFGTNDVTFTISGISQKLNGNPSKKYIEQVTVTYKDGNGITQTYGVYTAPSFSSVLVNITGNTSEVSVTLEDVYDGSTTSTMSVNLTSATACEPIGGCPDDDNDGVCNVDDICPGGDDNVDSDGDGIPDFCDLDTCPNTTDQFSNNPLTHQGTGVSSTSFSFLTETTDVTFDVTNIGSKLNGNPSNRYIDKVTIDYVDGSGSTINYDVYLGDAVSSASVSITGVVQSVTVLLEDVYDGDTGSNVISVDFSDIASCYTPVALPKKAEYNLNIYPNPVIGESVYVDFGLHVANAKIKVYDVLGKLVYSKSVVDEVKTKLDVSSFGNGAIYFVQIENEEGTLITKKLLLTK